MPRHALILLIEPYQAPLVIAAGCLIGSGALTLLYPVLVTTAVGVAGGSRVELVPFVVAAMLLPLAQAALAYAGARLVGGVSESVVRDLRGQVFGSYLGLEPSRWSEHTKGERLARISNDTAVLGSFLGATLPNATPPLVAALGALVVLASRDAVMLGALGVGLVPTAFLVHVLGRRLRAAAADALDSYGALYAQADETLTALPVVRAFGVEEPARQVFEGTNAALFASASRFIKGSALMGPVTRATASLGLLAAVATLFASGAAPFGPEELERTVEQLLYALLVVRPLGSLSSVYGRYQQGRAALHRITEEAADTGSAGGIATVRTPPRSSRSSPARIDIDTRAPLIARNLWFAYPDRDPLLQGVDLVVEPGRTVLVHGRNGSGKSTLIQILLRFLEPDEGALLAGERHAMDVSAASWRMLFGYVPQEPMLQNASVRRNLTLGRKFPDGRLREALELARADAFVDTLPDGLDTRLHDRGGGLSGGQLQRLALARALAGRPRFLLLDEATSMLDRESVVELLDANGRWRGSGGTLLVSHDRSLHAIADTVLELRDGKLHG